MTIDQIWPNLWPRLMTKISVWIQKTNTIIIKILIMLMHTLLIALLSILMHTLLITLLFILTHTLLIQWMHAFLLITLLYVYEYNPNHNDAHTPNHTPIYFFAQTPKHIDTCTSHFVDNTLWITLPPMSINTTLIKLQIVLMHTLLLTLLSIWCTQS